MPRFSVLAVILGSFASAACSPSESGAPGADGTPPAEPTGQTTEALTAYLTSEGSAPIRIDQLEIHANAETSASLTGSGCGSFVKPGEGGVRFRARANYPTAFVEWASRELARKPASAAPQITIAIANDKHDVKCGVVLEASVLEGLILNGGDVQDVGLVWEMKSGVKVAVGDVNGDGKSGGIGEGIGDVAAPKDEPVAIGMLLPAVQKVREAAMHAGDYPIFQKGVLVPPPFEVDIDEEAFADFFDGAIGNELEIGVLTPRPADTTGKTYYVGTANGGVWKTTNISFTVKLKKEALAGAEFKKRLKTVPVQGFEVVSPMTEARLAAARTRADSLAAETPAELDLDFVSRVVLALENQPAGSGAPSSRRDELLWYWRGDPAKGTPGAGAAFGTGLGSFLKKASDIEGLWAYARLPTAAKIFAQLGSPSGRALSEAATQSAPDAAFPLLPGRLRTTGDLGGHDYRVARAAVAQMAASTDIITGAGNGGQPLMGVEPDEIDVALASKNEVFPAVSSVDAAARNFLLAREALLDAPTVTDAALLDLSAKSAVLVKELDALSTVTKARFAAAK